MDAPPVEDAAAGKRVTRSLAPPAVVVLAMVAASVLPAGHPWLAVAASAVFWAGLVATIASLEPSVLRMWWVPVLAIVYFATFLAKPAALLIPDYVFNSDTWRYLREAAAHRIQVRHIGVPAVTFVAVGLGMRAVLAQCAAAGALLVGTFHALAGRLGSRGAMRGTLTVIFAFSLATWALSSAVESFALSALFLALTLSATAIWAESLELVDAMRVGWLVLASLGLSLENATVFPTLAVAIVAIGGGRRAAAGALAAAGIAGAGIAAWIPAVAAAQGPGFYATWGDQGFAAPATNVAENLVHFSHDYLAPHRLLTWRGHVETVWRIFVMSVRGLAVADPSRYPGLLNRPMFLAPGELLCAALLGGLALAALPRLARGWRERSAAWRATIAACLATLVVRHLFLTTYAWTQSLLFALPSLLALDLLLAAGLAPDADRGVARRWRAQAVAVALAALIVITNAWVLVKIQEDAPMDRLPPTASTWSRPRGDRADHARRSRSTGSKSGSSVSWNAPQCIGTIAAAPSARNASTACSGFMWKRSMNQAGA